MRLRFMGGFTGKLSGWVKRRSTKGAVALGVATGVIVLLLGGGVYAAVFGGSGQPSDSVDLQKGLVGYWKLNGNAKDSTPYQDDGTVSGATPAADRAGTAAGAYSFNGSSDFIGLGNPVPLETTGDQTISMWLDPLTPTARTNPFCKAYGGEGCITLETNGILHYYYGTAGTNGAPYQAFGTTLAIPFNTWSLITVTRDLSTMELTWYINGQQDNQATASYSSAAVSTLSALIGKGYAGNYAGSIDDVRVYNRAINASEVEALYNSYNPGVQLGSLESGLVGEWKLNGTAKDSTPYGHDGTINGTPVVAADREGDPSGALTLNSSTTGISLPAGALPQNFITVSAWVNQSTLANWYDLVSNSWGGAGSPQLPGWDFYTDSGGGFRFGLWNSPSGQSTAYCANAVTAGKWFLLTGTYDGTTLKAYVDGSLCSSVTSAYTNATLYNSGTWHIGDGAAGSQTISDVRIYNRALSAGEVGQLYDSYNSQINLGGSGSDTSADSVNLTKGLVGYWPFNGNAKDATPYSDNGTVNGATLTSDRLGRADSAYTLGSTNQWINVGNPSSFSNLPKAFTYSLWLDWSGTNSTGQWPEIMGCSNTHVYFGIRTSNYGANIYFEYGKSPYDGSSFAGSSAFSLTPNTWYMYTVTYDGSTLKIYKNGTFVSQTTSVSLNPSFGGLQFATSASGWDGSVDDARVYNRAISATEVQALYNLDS